MYQYKPHPGQSGIIATDPRALPPHIKALMDARNQRQTSTQPMYQAPFTVGMGGYYQPPPDLQLPTNQPFHPSVQSAPHLAGPQSPRMTYRMPHLRKPLSMPFTR